MAKLPRPDGHQTLTPASVVPGAAKVIAFLEKAFDARVVDRYDAPNGAVAHAEVMIRGSVLMLAEPMMGWDPMPAAISLYVDDGPEVDAVHARAVAAGATSVSEPKDQFYGYRSACVKDVGGNRWTICAVIEIVPAEEIARRMAEMMKG